MYFNIWNRRYTGSKYKISDWIVDLINQHCKGDSFCDLFAGTGVISAKMLQYYISMTSYILMQLFTLHFFQRIHGA